MAHGVHTAAPAMTVGKAVLGLVMLSTACVGDLRETGPARPRGATPPSPSCTSERPAVSEMRRLSVVQYRAAIRDVFEAEVAPSPSYPGSSGQSDTGFTTEARLLYPSVQSVEDVMEAAEDVAVGVHDALPSLLPCASADPGEACAVEFVERYARRAFRRSPTESERALLLGVYRDGIADGATFAEAVALLTAQMLELPQFLYVAEDAAGESRALSGIETASRLSFLFWDSIPDDELLDLAESGALETPEAVTAQAERMIAAPQAEATLARFLREWSGTREVSPADKLAERYPEFDAGLARSMNESFDRLAVSSVRGGGIAELLRSRDVPVDATLAAFLGVAPPASGWGVVALDPARSSGLVTHPALLASLAHASDDHPAYVLRGRFLREQILCDELGSPPATAMAEFESIPLPPDPTAREMSASVRARPACGACHARIDPGGLAFERFDAIGRYRESYDSGRAIEVSGALSGLDGADIAFEDHVALMDALADHAAVRACFARQIFRFALSRLDSSDDECAVERVGAVLASEGATIGDALVALSASDAFRYRRDGVE